MNSYTIRTQSGESKVRISASIAKEVFNQVAGFFRTAKYDDGRSCTVYEIKEDLCFGYTIPDEGEFKVYLWKGDTICPKFH